MEENMSEFWSNLGRKVNSVSNSAAKKVDALTTIAKLNLSLRDKENSLEECFEKLGSLVYDKVRRSYETDEEVALCIDEADKLLADIASIKAQLRQAKKTKACETCGKDCAADAHFCPACGIAFGEEKEEATDIVVAEEKTEE
jgi:RNA polymerase subunit RPABC4/transcription elongation factor Spt4